MDQTAPNTKNLNDLKKWLEATAHLSTNDQAQLANVSSKTIRRWRKRVSVQGQPNKPTPRYTKIPNIPTVDVPDDWRNDIPWMTKMVQVYNISTLARLVNRDYSTVYDIIKKRNIKTKSSKEAMLSKNKCCTHEWCFRHYITLGYGQVKCAKLAGIAVQTFSDWLNRFKIPVRDQEQTENRRKVITIWEKDFIARLRQNSTVRRVYVRDGYIHVRYMNYFWENYYTRYAPNVKRPYTYFAINQENTRLTKIPIIHHEYGTDLDGVVAHPTHIALSRADLKTASMAETRVAIHEFARQLITRGWIHPSFPNEILHSDFNGVINLDTSKHLENGGYNAMVSGQAPLGRKVMLQFFDTSIFWEIFKRPRIIVQYLNALYQKKTKFNWYNLLMCVAGNIGNVITHRKALKFPGPAVYVAIFKNLGLTGTLLDVNVGFGNRAVASAATGLRYTTADPAFNHALERGFTTFSGLEYEPYAGQMVDVAIYDEGFKKPDMTKIIPYLDKAKKFLVFCPSSHAQEVLKYKPQTAIRVRTRLYRKAPDYIFVW